MPEGRTLALDVVPLFESGAKICATRPACSNDMLKLPAGKAASTRRDRSGGLEVMLGYSDSAKESSGGSRRTLLLYDTQDQAWARWAAR